MKRILLVALLGLLALFLVKQYPDMQRYLKIKRM